MHLFYSLTVELPFLTAPPAPPSTHTPLTASRLLDQSSCCFLHLEGPALSSRFLPIELGLQGIWYEAPLTAPQTCANPSSIPVFPTLTVRLHQGEWLCPKQTCDLADFCV